MMLLSIHKFFASYSFTLLFEDEEKETAYLNFRRVKNSLATIRISIVSLDLIRQ